MSFKGYVRTAGDSPGVFTSNTLAFETEDEAELYVKDLASRWTAVVDWRVQESDEPVSHTITSTGVLKRVGEGS